MVELEEPDKGRAWLVAFAACIINMILSGLSRMIGILYVAVLETYGVSRAEATLPFTVRNAIRCLSGPLVGIIGQRFGIRVVTFFGGVVASLGAALCCIAPSITWLAVFWGGMHGLGFAFANTLFQVVVNQYFQKYRATASGIALSGACVGSLAFPFIIEHILDTYALSGGFLILGGIVMHVLPLSLVLSSPQWIEYPEAYARLRALQNKKNLVKMEGLPVEEQETSSHEAREPPSRLLRHISTSTTSLSNCPMECVRVCNVCQNCEQKERISGVFSPNTGQCRLKPKLQCSAGVICTLYKIKESPKEKKRLSIQNGHSPSDGDSVYSISKQLNDTDKEVPDAEVIRPKKSPTKNQNTQSIGESLRSIVRLYKNPVYLLISICMSTYIIIFIPILTVLVDYSMDKGIPASAGKYLINAMAMGDLIGRLGFGWVTDKKLMTIPAFMTLDLVLEGVFIALFPFATSLASYMILLVLYGITAGSILVLFPVLVLQYVETHEQSVAIACVGFLSGIMSLAIPSMIGHFRDEVGSYDGMFYLTGLLSVVSGGMWLLEPVVVKRYYGKKKEKEENGGEIVQNNSMELNNKNQEKAVS